MFSKLMLLNSLSDEKKKYAESVKLIKVETFSTATALSTHISLSLHYHNVETAPLSPPSLSVLRYSLSLTRSLALSLSPLSREGLSQTDVTQR